ncbi:DUF2254 domain-containing protein [Chondromyces crocatus]|uniref:DUF2254 domain-containing protein n=1 Tax=Chondromyces crocatus TaxID=52 RepID=A0A0K1EE40_CHOCO|nr:DUF2254 domain-containing protein [Chondromyces crocatus]AKT38962.1 uncharacterized protein CMC5_031090 [Chondromyces crocatus]
MRAQYIGLTERLRVSYWFIPSVMSVMAIVLAGTMLELDSHFGSDWMDDFGWLYAARPDGARHVLSALGGSMLTVAGTVFSVTIATVVTASGQYGPRLINNFMSDRGNQVTLGTFLATYLYSLMVLRTIHGAAESTADMRMRATSGFVPNLALLVGVVLAICSIGVLIFFIHHVPSHIQINHVIAQIGRRLVGHLDEVFPGRVRGGEGVTAATEDVDARLPPVFRQEGEAMAGEATAISVAETGYLQVIETGSLVKVATERDVVLRLLHQPGDYVQAGRGLVEVWPPERVDEGLRRALRRCFVLGGRRIAVHDLGFLVDELVEIAARALSPGVNDPFTAMSCLDWLGAAMSKLAGRAMPDPVRVDRHGAARLVARPVSFASCLSRSFGRMRLYGCKDTLVVLHFLSALGEVVKQCDDPARLDLVEDEARRMVESATPALSEASVEEVQRRMVALRGEIAAARAGR